MVGVTTAKLRTEEVGDEEGFCTFQAPSEELMATTREDGDRVVVVSKFTFSHVLNELVWEVADGNVGEVSRLRDPRRPKAMADALSSRYIV